MDSTQPSTAPSSNPAPPPPSPAIETIRHRDPQLNFYLEFDRLTNLEPQVQAPVDSIADHFYDSVLTKYSAERRAMLQVDSCMSQPDSFSYRILDWNVVEGIVSIYYSRFEPGPCGLDGAYLLGLGMNYSLEMKRMIDWEDYFIPNRDSIDKVIDERVDEHFHAFIEKRYPDEVSYRIITPENATSAIFTMRNDSLVLHFSCYTIEACHDLNSATDFHMVHFPIAMSDLEVIRRQK